MNRYIIAVILVLSMVWINIGNAEMTTVRWLSSMTSTKVVPTDMTGHKQNNTPETWKSKIYKVYVNEKVLTHNVMIQEYTDSILVLENVSTKKITVILLNENTHIVLRETK